MKNKLTYTIKDLLSSIKIEPKETPILTARKVFLNIINSYDEHIKLSAILVDEIIDAYTIGDRPRAIKLIMANTDFTIIGATRIIDEYTSWCKA